MIGTIISLGIALFFSFNSIGKEMVPDLHLFSLILVSIGILFIFVLSLSLAISWGPLQKTEQNLTPRVLEMFQIDRHFQLIHYWFIFFVLASCLIAADVLFLNFLKKNILLALWIFLLGVSLDFFYYFYRRMTHYLNPFAVIKMFTKEAKKSIQDDREVDLCDWIDALSETAIKTVHQSGSALCVQSMDSIQVIARHFLESSKSIGHQSQDSQIKALGIADKVSYTLFHILQRLESINQKALEKNLETVCSSMITIVGKIAIYAGKFDLTLTSYPVNYLDKFAQESLKYSHPEVAVKATLTLVQIAKSIIQETDTTYSDLKDPFNSIITHMEEITKSIFKQDKNINLQILTQPFKELKELFKDPKVIAHQDTPVILQSIDNILGQYAALETIMRTIPPIPEMNQEGIKETSAKGEISTETPTEKL